MTHPKAKPARKPQDIRFGYDSPLILDVAEAAQHYRDTEHSTPEILWGTLDRLAEVGNDE